MKVTESMIDAAVAAFAPGSYINLAIVQHRDQMKAAIEAAIAQAYTDGKERK